MNPSLSRISPSLIYVANMSSLLFKAEGQTKGYDRSVGESDDFEARLSQSGDCSEQYQMHLSTDIEWEVECVDYRKWDSCDSKATSGSDEPLEVSDRDWEVDSINELEAIIPGRESEYSSTSAYHSSYSGYNSL